MSLIKGESNMKRVEVGTPACITHIILRKKKPTAL